MTDFPEPGARRRGVTLRNGDTLVAHSRIDQTDEGDRLTIDKMEVRRAHSNGATRQALKAVEAAGTMDEAVAVVADFNANFKAQQEAAKAATFRHAVMVEPDGTVTDPTDDRPVRKHANAKYEKDDRRFDTTALHSDVHSTLISHADYQAHNEKWDYVWRSILKGDRILDVGCGTDLPLLVAINRSQSQATKLLIKEGGCYTGVDMNKLKTTGIAWATLLGETDMTSEEGYDRAMYAVPGNNEAVVFNDYRGYTMIVCLEVIEHMQVPDGRKLLENFRDLLSPGGRIILSTPVYDGKAMARNHIHEYYAAELAQLIESVGLTIEKRMGTFTAEPVIKPWLKANRPEWYDLYMEAREFHSAGYMSGLMAPMFPDLSRNNVWLLRA